MLLRAGFGRFAGLSALTILCGLWLVNPASAQLEQRTSHEAVMWSYRSKINWIAGRAGSTPALATIYNDSGLAQEYHLHYWLKSPRIFLDMSFAAGTSSGVKHSDEFCMGAYEFMVDCSSPPPLSSRGESFVDGKISMLTIDMRQRVLSLKKQNAADVTSPPVVNYDWLVGYLRLEHAQNSFGLTYQTGGSGNIDISSHVMSSVSLWDVGRLGGSMEYFHKGKRGAWRTRAELAYLLTNLSVEVGDFLYADRFGGAPNIRLSGTGTGLMSEVSLRYLIDENKQMGFGYRYMTLNASGTQQLGPIFVQLMDLSTFEFTAHGPMIFFNFAF